MSVDTKEGRELLAGRRLTGHLEVREFTVCVIQKDFPVAVVAAECFNLDYAALFAFAINNLPALLDAADERDRLKADNERLRGKLTWSWLRNLIDQGMAIRQDYDAGKYRSYEELSRRLDDAARERLEELENKPMTKEQQQVMEAALFASAKVQP